MSHVKSQRPLSPHVGIYRWQITNTLSILHRITGFGLSLGLIPLALWLWGIACAPELFLAMSGFWKSILGQLMLAGWMLAFYYHLGNGIRHLNWDLGNGFALSEVVSSGRVVVVFALAMSVFTWVTAL